MATDTLRRARDVAVLRTALDVIETEVTPTPEVEFRPPPLPPEEPPSSPESEPEPVAAVSTPAVDDSPSQVETAMSDAAAAKPSKPIERKRRAPQAPTGERADIPEPVPQPIAALAFGEILARINWRNHPDDAQPLPLIGVPKPPGYAETVEAVLEAFNWDEP